MRHQVEKLRHYFFSLKHDDGGEVLEESQKGAAFIRKETYKII